MTTMDHFDPFARATDVVTLISGGRYRLPDLKILPDGALITGDERPYGWQRVTTLIKAIADAYMLDLWHQRQIIIGLVADESLYDLACATDLTDRDKVNELASKALAQARSHTGSNTGTALHGFLEAEELGIRHYARTKWHGKISNYISTRDRHRLRVIPHLIERIIVNLTYGIAGTFDRVFLDEVTDEQLIGDNKSQKAFWSWNEISAQLAAYALADAMWDKDRLCYVSPPQVSQDVAVVMWVPSAPAQADDPDWDPDRVEVFNVDLEPGRQWLETAYQVNRMRSAGKSAHQTIASLRPLPPMTQVETYAARLTCVESPAEGSMLWAEIVAHGLDQSPELVAVATDVAARFSPRIS